MSAKNVWLLVSGPSGVGKTTLIARLLEKYSPKLQAVVTATDRPQRLGEEEGKHYYFLSSTEFKKRKANGEFLETIERHGAHYGTLKSEIKEKLDNGHDLIMHIDWRGRQTLEALAKKEGWLKKAVISIFLKPKDIQALKERIEKRGQNTKAEITLRIKEASEDLSHAPEYTHVIESGSETEDLKKIQKIYKNAKRI